MQTLVGAANAAGRASGAGSGGEGKGLGGRRSGGSRSRAVVQEGGGVGGGFGKRSAFAVKTAGGGLVGKGGGLAACLGHGKGAVSALRCNRAVGEAGRSGGNVRPFRHLHVLQAGGVGKTGGGRLELRRGGQRVAGLGGGGSRRGASDGCGCGRGSRSRGGSRDGGRLRGGNLRGGAVADDAEGLGGVGTPNGAGSDGRRAGLHGKLLVTLAGKRGARGVRAGNHASPARNGVDSPNAAVAEVGIRGHVTHRGQRAGVPPSVAEGATPLATLAGG